MYSPIYIYRLQLQAHLCCNFKLRNTAFYHTHWYYLLSDVLLQYLLLIHYVTHKQLLTIFEELIHLSLELTLKLTHDQYRSLFLYTHRTFWITLDIPRYYKILLDWAIIGNPLVYMHNWLHYICITINVRVTSKQIAPNRTYSHILTYSTDFQFVNKHHNSLNTYK